MDKRVLRLIGALNAWVYRASGGKWLGRFPGGAPVLLLTTTGRKSGQARTAPLLYLDDEGDFVVVASQGGAPQHPGWYVNLVAQPAAEVQVGERHIPVTASTATADDKAALWPRLVALYPPYDAYQRRTPRQIPVVRLRPVRP
jgi:F420H(2)-dependent quinone reductase